MSFARAPLKRFNEHVGCSTGPGDYDIKPAELKGPVTFHRSDRFRPNKEAAADLPPPPPPPSPSRSVSMSPLRIRRTMSADVLVEGSSAKKGRSGVTMEMKLQWVLEKEIRSMVQQRGEQDQKLQSLEEELKKLHAKLLTAVREKTALSANMATLERQLAELNKANKFLKNKASADTTKKQINSLMMELMEARNNLDAKNKELSDLHITTEGQLQALETDLQTNRTALTTLRDRRSDLEDLHQATKSRNEELEKEMDRLHALMEELRAEVRALQEYLDMANDEIQDLRRKCNEREEPDETATKVQQEKLCDLEREVERRTVELQHLQSVVRQKEEESASCQQKLGASQDTLSETEERLNSCEVELRCSQEALGAMAVQMKETSEALEESLGKVSQQGTELTRLRDVLRRTEQEGDERTSQLAESRLRHEEAMSRIQQDGLRRVEELETELGALRAVGTEERNEQIQLQQDHAALTEQMQKEKALVASLSLLLQQEKAESDQRMKDLRDEMEEVLGELAAMEEQEGSRRGMLTETQGGFLVLQQDHAELEKELSETRALLDSKMKEMSALEENHSLAMRSLQEQHTDSLHKTRDTAAELESIKQSLQQAEERSRTLEEEVERVTHQMKEEMVTTIQKKDDDARRMREETDGIHRAAQEEWERKIKEMSALEEKHSMAMRSLQEQHTDSLHKTSHTAAELESIKQSLQQAEERSRTLEEVERVTHQMKEEMVATVQKKDDDARRMREETDGIHRAAQEEWKRELKRTEASHATLARRLKEQVKSVEASHATLGDQQEEQMKCLQEQVETLAQEKVTLQWEMLEQTKDLEGQLAEAQDRSSSEWKQKYEELLAKVKPFQEQLNGFAAEKDALLNMNGSNQEELNRLAEAYARLLGHQNHKQKIKHMVKLKDENLALKQEVSNLRSQVTRQKSQMEQLRSEIPGAARRRFDPSKAFQSDVKENRQPETPVALRDGGNHHYL